MAAAAAVGVALAAVGALSGGRAGFAQPADAAILHGAAAAFAPGSIVSERYDSVQVTGGNAPRVERAHGWQVSELPTGSGAPNALDLSDPSLPEGAEIGQLDGSYQLYDPTSDTVFVASIYGPYISAGAQAGTYVYAAPVGAAGATQPLVITAAQRQGLLDGTLIVTRTERSGGPATAQIVRAVSASSPAALIRDALAAGQLRVIAHVTLDGRAAITLASSDGRREEDVAPGTYVPVRTVTHDGSATVTTVYSEYRVTAASPAGEHALLDLTVRHPNARVDRSPAGFAAAYTRIFGTAPLP